MCLRLRLYQVRRSRDHFTLNELFHPHHIYSGQVRDPAIGVCVTVGCSFNKTKSLAQGSAGCLRRADVQDEAGKAPLFAEIDGPPRQL